MTFQEFLNNLATQINENLGSEEYTYVNVANQIFFAPLYNYVKNLQLGEDISNNILLAENLSWWLTEWCDIYYTYELLYEDTDLILSIINQIIIRHVPTIYSKYIKYKQLYGYIDKDTSEFGNVWTSSTTMNTGYQGYDVVNQQGKYRTDDNVHTNQGTDILSFIDYLGRRQDNIGDYIWFEIENTIFRKIYA